MSLDKVVHDLNSGLSAVTQALEILSLEGHSSSILDLILEKAKSNENHWNSLKKELIKDDK